MAKVWFDFSAATNGDGTSPSSPKNTLAGYTFVSGNEHYFRRGTTYAGAFTMVAGKPGRRTKYLTWYNADGTDDQNQLKPIFNATAVLSTYNSTNKDHVEISGLDLRAPAIAVAADTYLVVLGHNSFFTNCAVDTNVGGVSAPGKSNANIMYNTVKAVSYAGAFSNNCINASDNLEVDTVNIIGNTVTFMGGGTTNCLGIRAECSDATLRMTNLRVEGNTVTPPVGTAYTPNQNSIGIRLQGCPDAEVCFNTVKGMLNGISLVDGRIWAHHNTLQSNLNFGLHLSADSYDCLLEYNDCSFNGTNISNATMFAYGRGIEMSSAAGQSRCARHTVRFNVCNGNLNYGGKDDNGSEGVGIGLDDGTSMCVLYGNVLVGNEGNGVQYFGGDKTNAAIVDTGGNHCVANYFENNCTAAFKNRRTGGTTKTSFISHISVAAAYGTKSIIANNVMKGGQCGISMNSNTDKTKLLIANNVFLDIPHCISAPDAVNLDCRNNLFYSATVTVQKYCTNATDVNGVPTFPNLVFNGVNDVVQDPKFDANYRPLPGSILLGNGYSAGKFLDFVGKEFKGTPNIGMFANYPSVVSALRI
jgi:hypothetical protein